MPSEAACGWPASLVALAGDDGRRSPEIQLVMAEPLKVQRSDLLAGAGSCVATACESSTAAGSDAGSLLAKADAVGAIARVGKGCADARRLDGNADSLDATAGAGP